MPDAPRYPHVVRMFQETPWALLPEKLLAMREVLILHLNGTRLSPEDVQARIGAAAPRRDAVQQRGTAIIPVYGVIAPRADAMTQTSGGTSIDRLTGAFRAAVRDDNVSAILLDVDSPGGSSDLVSEFAAEIRQARGSKPIVAIANTVAASAAYWIASQADEVVVTPSGSVGSIGVFAAHEDISGQEAQDGVKTTLISAGRYKVEANPYEPLSDEARAYIQSRVDEMYGMFVDDVAAGRSVTTGIVESGFGEGRMLSARSALDAGMVDRVETIDQTLHRLDAHASSASVANQQAALTLNSSSASVAWQQAALTPNSSSAVMATNPPWSNTSMTVTDRIRATRSDLAEILSTVRGFADVRDGHLTGAKREQLGAILAALGDLEQVRADIAQLMVETDPHRPSREGAAAVAAYQRRRVRERTA